MANDLFPFDEKEMRNCGFWVRAILAMIIIAAVCFGITIGHGLR